MRGFWAIGAIGWLSACLPAGEFACEENAQCSRLADGVCQADGFCSYPDDGCESGQRYSGFAGPVAGTCVTLGGGTSTSGDETGSSDGSSDDSGDSGDSGSIPTACDGIDCSGAGTCVVVDSEPTCACDPGLYPVELECMEDPCAAAQCYFVDAIEGDDDADGSRQAPWQTIARLQDALALAEPGDHFLLRRGRQWAAQSRLDVTAIDGTVLSPVVIGAYGPIAEPAPRLVATGSVIARSQHVVLRDLWFEDSTGPCIKVEDSDYVVVQDNIADRCEIRGIRVDVDSDHSVIVGNRVSDVVGNTSIFIGDTIWTDPPTEVDSHHWIIDNVVVRAPDDAIAVTDTNDPLAERSITDVKIAGNTVIEAGDLGIRLGIEGRGWVVGNTIVAAGDEMAGMGGGLGMHSDGLASGNVIVRSRDGLTLRGQGSTTYNTIVHEGSRSAFVVEPGAREQQISHNLVLARGGVPWVELVGSDWVDDVAAMDLNGYATDGPACSFRVASTDLDLQGLVDLTGFDAGSSCETVPGFGTVPDVGGVQDIDSAFWQSLQPDPDWARCDDPAGSRDCDGLPLGDRIDAIPQIDDNEGRGWAGPLVVRQRYDTSS